MADAGRHMGEHKEIEMDVARPEPTKAKPTQVLSKAPKSSPLETSQAAVMRGALVTAQHWLEHGGASGSWLNVAKHVETHVAEAVSLIGRSSAFLEVAGQLDETYRAMDAYILRTAPQLRGSEADSFRAEFKAIRSVTENMRRALKMQHHPSTRGRRPASNTNDAYEGAALEATLDLIALEATAAVGHAETNQTLALNAVATLLRDLSYAGSLLDVYGGTDKAKRFTAKAGSAGLALAKLQRVVNDKQDNKSLREAFKPVEAKSNELMGAIKLPLIADIELKTSNKRDGEKDEATAEITAARSTLRSAFTTLNTRIGEGAFIFYELATKEDEPDPSALWSEMVKGLLISLIANVIGPGVGALASKLGIVAAEKAVDLVANTATDTLQAWADSVQAAESEAKTDSDKNKAALYFKRSVVLGADKTRSLIETDFDDRITDRSVSASEIRHAATLITNAAKGAATRTLHHSARDFALMLAQRSLGADAKPGAKRTEKQTTRIGSDYQYGPGWEDGKRTGAEGIARLRIRVRDSGNSVDHYELVGLNKDMAKAVFDGAQGRIGKLGVPTEIELSSDQSGHKELVVVDEGANIRFSTGWQLFRQESMRKHARTFGSPDKAWEELRHYIIPDTFKRSVDE